MSERPGQRYWSGPRVNCGFNKLVILIVSLFLQPLTVACTQYIPGPFTRKVELVLLSCHINCEPRLAAFKIKVLPLHSEVSFPKFTTGSGLVVNIIESRNIQPFVLLVT